MAFGNGYNPDTDLFCNIIMLTRFADFFQQGNRWLNWLHKQPEGPVRPSSSKPPQKSWPVAFLLWAIPAGAALTPDVVTQKSLLPL